MGATVRDVVGVMVAIVGLAAIAVIFTSPRTASIIAAGGTAATGLIEAATLHGANEPAYGAN